MTHTFIERLPTGEDPVVLLRNLYSQEELSAMMGEVESICRLNLMQSGSKTGSAVDNTGNVKVNFGVFLDAVFTPDKCVINNTVKSKMFQMALVDILAREHYLFRYMIHTNRKENLLSYYSTNGSYSEHRDGAVLTALLYLWKQPKQFKGGDLVFPETGYTYTPEFGDVIIFPSILLHAVTPVTLTSSESYSGRFVVSTFMGTG